MAAPGRHFDETAGFACALLRGQIPVLPPGAMPIVDVRETAPRWLPRRPARETIADTILWLHEHGDLSDKHVGRLVAPAAA